jgi:alkylated DNA repair protein alkB family protein 6
MQLIVITVREELPDWLRGCTSKLDAAGLFDGRNADHVLINEYLPGQGIMAHEDGPFFYPVIVNITLGSHTMLELSAKETTSGDDADGDTASRVRIGKVLLQPNSMMVMRDDLYSCLHGIDEIAEDVVDESVLNAAECGVSPGTVMPRGTRVSLTIRSAMRSAKLPVLRLAKSSK